MSDFRFDEATHTYTLRGQRLPSVTEILEPLNNLAGIPAEVLEVARTRGKRVHAAVHALHENRLDWSEVESYGITGYVLAFMRFQEVTGIKILTMEQPLYSEDPGYAGTPDFEAMYFGKRSVWDIKASFAIPATVGPQTAAYQNARNQLKNAPRVSHRYALHLREDGRYTVQPLEDPSDLATFFGCFTVYQWRKRHYD